MQLRPTKQRSFCSNIYGYDIETANKNKEFVLASVWNENPRFRKFFYTKQEFINHLRTRHFRNSIIAATNLGFDFFGTFFNEPEINKFRLLTRGSSLLYAKTYTDHKGGFHIKSGKGKDRILFLDTGNYAMVSVDKLGELLKVKKLDKPDFLGKRPRNKKEWKILEAYNMRDSEISCKAMTFLHKTFYDLGATPKITIASTSMSLFRNKYLKDVYYRHDEKDLLEQFKAYYGGRTEAIGRGIIKDYNYYDINSLYPYVMEKYAYPNPNTLNKNYTNTLLYIKEYEGIAEVLLQSPNSMRYPLLPLRTEDKLIFPLGTFRGYYSNVELRKAIKLGYKIKRVYRNFWFKSTCRPFKEFVNDLYNKRIAYKNENSPIEFVIKILMNSLYGKFGQKFINRDDLQPFNQTKEELDKLEWFEGIPPDKPKFIRIKKEYVKPPCFTIPIWALYVTAYARLELYNLISKYNPVYYDTDSVITKKFLNTSTKLGGLKQELRIRRSIIVKPKFYALEGYENKGILSFMDSKKFVKIKGVGVKMTLPMFYKLMSNPKISYTKFTKIREALRRGFLPNEIIDITKELKLEDNKRLWKKPFSITDYELSNPLTVKHAK